MTRWRNGSASDSRSEGCVFKSRPGHPFFFFFFFKECIQQTFDDIVQQNIPEGYEGHPGLNKDKEPFEFYYYMLDGMEVVENEDRQVYQPLIPKYVVIII